MVAGGEEQAREGVIREPPFVVEVVLGRRAGFEGARENGSSFSLLSVSFML